MAIRGEHVESCKPISAIFDYTHVMLKASSYSSCRTPSVPQPDSVIFRYVICRQWSPYYHTTMTRPPPYATRCLLDLHNCDSASSRTTSPDASIRKWNPATIPSRAVEAEFAQRQAFGIEAHIARSNDCLALYYGPSVVKDHLLEYLPSENSKV